MKLITLKSYNAWTYFSCEVELVVNRLCNDVIGVSTGSSRYEAVGHPGVGVFMPLGDKVLGWVGDRLGK